MWVLETTTCNNIIFGATTTTTTSRNNAAAADCPSLCTLWSTLRLAKAKERHGFFDIGKRGAMCKRNYASSMVDPTRNRHTHNDDSWHKNNQKKIGRRCLPLKEKKKERGSSESTRRWKGVRRCCCCRRPPQKNPPPGAQTREGAMIMCWWWCGFGLAMKSFHGEPGVPRCFRFCYGPRNIDSWWCHTFLTRLSHGMMYVRRARKKRSPWCHVSSSLLSNALVCRIFATLYFST